MQDLDREDDIPEPWREGELAMVIELQKREKEASKRIDAIKFRKLKELGFDGENAGEVLL